MEQIFNIDTSPDTFFDWLESITMYLDPDYPHPSVQPTYQIMLQPTKGEKYILTWEPGTHNTIPFLMRRHQPYYRTHTPKLVLPMTLRILAIALFDSKITDLPRVQEAIKLTVEESKTEQIRVTIQCHFAKVEVVFFEFLRLFANEWEYLREKLKPRFLSEMVTLATTMTEKEEYRELLERSQTTHEQRIRMQEPVYFVRVFQHFIIRIWSFLRQVTQKIDVLASMQKSSLQVIEAHTADLEKLRILISEHPEAPDPPDIGVTPDDWFDWYHLYTDVFGHKMTLRQLAEKMGLSYGRVRHLHSEYQAEHKPNNGETDVAQR